MTLDMWFLAENANPSGTPLLNKFWCAALQPVIITLGTIPRFLLGECRFKYRTKGDPTSVRPWAWALGGLSYAGACAVFAVCLYSLVEFIWKDGTPPDVGMRLQDANVVTALALAQIGYPVVSLYAIIYMHCLCAKNKWRERGDTYPAMLSCNKDVAFAALDVSTKGGLALYAASRALWL
jgi:hypothetical protein